MKKNLTLDNMLPFGKYKDTKIERVYKENVGYLAWMRDQKEKDGEKDFFSKEVLVLIDHAISNSKHLQKRFKEWGVTVDGLTTSETPEQEMRNAISAGSYEAWGAF